MSLVVEQLQAADVSVRASNALAAQAHTAQVGGALSPVMAADILERSYVTRLRALEIEQALAELQVALSLATGSHVR